MAARCLRQEAGGPLYNGFFRYPCHMRFATQARASRACMGVVNRLLWNATPYLLESSVVQQRTRQWIFWVALGLSASANAATDINCSSARVPGQRIICDYTIVGHEYDDLYAQQQRMAASGVLSQGQVADFRARRDACADVGCVEKVIADWQTHANALNRAQTDASRMQAVGANGAAANGVAPSAVSMPATDQPPPPPVQDPNAPPTAAQTQYGAPTQITDNLVPVSPSDAASGAAASGTAAAAAAPAAVSDPSTMPTAERNALAGSQDDRPSTAGLLRNGALLILLVAIGTAIWRTRRRLRGRADNRRAEREESRFDRRPPR